MPLDRGTEFGIRDIFLCGIRDIMLDIEKYEFLVLGILAHLVPASVNADIRDCLKLSNDDGGIWSLRNGY